MIKLIAQYETQVEGRLGRFMMEHDTPVTIARIMALEFISYLDNVENNAKMKSNQDEQASNEPETKVEGNLVEEPTQSE
jgi:hypothetical protein